MMSDQAFRIPILSDRTIFLQIIFRGVRWGFLLGLVCGAVAGLPIFLIGALFGMVIGLLVGMLAGGVSGLILSIFSLRFYNPISQNHYRQYRIAAVFICVLASLIVVNTLNPFPPSKLNENARFYPFVFILIPDILAALYCSQKLAQWYIRYRGLPS